MLVYANHLRVQGADAEPAIFRAVGGWLKEQLGFGLHPSQLRQDGEFNGHRGGQRSHLRIHGCYDSEPALCAWILKHSDDNVNGRQWIVEAGVKKVADTLEVSCVVKTDERSALVLAPVSASQPRVMRYLANNVLSAEDADFANTVVGGMLKKVGQDSDSYRGLLAEIERTNRDGAIVLVSATSAGEYLVDPAELQKTLFGLGQVVQVLSESNRYEMAEILGQRWSAWDGSVNVLAIPSASGVRSRYFLRNAIEEWGDEPQRTSQILAWVTASTNIARLRMHVRPEGVMQLSMRRRLDKVLATRDQMNAAQLRQALDEASRQTIDHESLLEAAFEENGNLEAELSRYKDDLTDAQDELRTKEYELKSLKDTLSATSDRGGDTIKSTRLLRLAAGRDEPNPLDCIEIIERLYGDRCTVLESARSSAKKMKGFVNGRYLFDLLERLVTTYRDRLMKRGDSAARRVFGRGEYAAKESKSVMANPMMRRQRTFNYDGAQVEMFRHLKLGVADDPTQTIRVHFHWDGDRNRVVIGYCGEHLPVTGH